MVGKAAVRLHLPAQWTRIHNVFHVSLVKHYKARPWGQERWDYVEPPPPLQFLDGEPLFEVEEIKDHEVVRRGRGWSYNFFISSKGYSEEHDKWEPEKNLLTCDEMLRHYKARNGLPWRARDLMLLE